MAFDRQTFIDLLTCSSSAPYPGARYAANALLARELIARRAVFGPHSQPKPPYAEFYWQDQEFASQTLSLGALAFSNPLAPPSLRIPSGYGNADRASYYLGYPDGWGGVVLSTTDPDTAAAYASFVPAATVVAGQLRDVVINGWSEGSPPYTIFAGMGSTAWNAARQTYVDYFAAVDLAKSGIFSYYRIAGSCTAAAGDAFPLQSGDLAAGYGVVTPDDTAQITVPSSGSYTVRIQEGAVRSDSTANPTTVTVSLRVSGSEVASLTATRNSADPSEYVHVKLDPTILTIDGPLTVVNGSSDTARAVFALTIWRTP